MKFARRRIPRASPDRADLRSHSGTRLNLKGTHRVALLGAVMLQLLACQDTTRPVAPDPGTPLSAKAPAPAEGIVISAPLFGLDAAPDGRLLAAVASVGVVGIRAGATDIMANLPGVSGIAAIGSGDAFTTTGGSDDPDLLLPSSRKLFRVSRGSVREIADLWAFEQAVNPDQVWNDGPPESNPFKVVALNGGRVLVADAAANAILVVDANGTVDWVAVLTPRSTPGPQPVATSIAVGPDGAYYAGELTGFPGTPGLSRIWRIAPGSRQVLCPSAACTVFADGFTSIMDLAFGPDGTLYVVEFDEAGWLAVEQNGFARTTAGGTVNACNVSTGSCSALASGLSLPTTVAVDRNGTVWLAEHQPILFAAALVRPLP